MNLRVEGEVNQWNTMSFDDGKRLTLQRAWAETGDEQVVSAMARVPRERFLPAAQREGAYVDSALPLPYEQAISQPTMVGIMTSALRLQPTDKVFEVSTGSSYQAAVLVELAGRVVTMERIPDLSIQARAFLVSLDTQNVSLPG